MGKTPIHEGVPMSVTAFTEAIGLGATASARTATPVVSGSAVEARSGQAVPSAARRVSRPRTARVMPQEWHERLIALEAADITRRTLVQETRSAPGVVGIDSAQIRQIV